MYDVFCACVKIMRGLFHANFAPIEHVGDSPVYELARGSEKV